jgi:TRAP-type C4-dicarboxylate transport system permease small subunit
MFTRIVGVLIGITKVVMVTAFVTMIALTLAQVLNRYAVGLSIFWTEELIVLLLVWSMLLGLPVQLWAHEEIVVDVLPLPEGFWTRAKIFLASAFSLLFCVILLYSGYAFANRGWPVSSPGLNLSRFWFFVPIPLSAGLAILALLARNPAQPVASTVIDS